MSTELLNFINIIIVPVISGIIVWMWKLDARIFDLHKSVLTREEFLEEMRVLRTEIAELRKEVKQ
jgi:hypothetical protein